MAAIDKFESFNQSVASPSPELLKEVVATNWVDILAARSEEARERIVVAHIKQVHQMLQD